MCERETYMHATPLHVRKMGDKVFGERCCAITDFFFNTDAHEYFPDVDNLFCDMDNEVVDGYSSNTRTCFLYSIRVHA